MRIIPLLLLVLLSLALPAQAAQKCDYSGDDWDASSTRLSIGLEVDGQPTTLHFSSLYFMFRYLNEAEAAGHSLGQISSFNMLDYHSYGTGREQFIDGTGQTKPQGWFLWTNHELPGSSFPYIAAFSEQAFAKEAADEWGGELLDGEQMLLELYRFFGERHGIAAR